MSKPKGPRPKHTPQRTCVVCRSEHSKRELMRIVRLPAGASQSDGSLKGVVLNVNSHEDGPLSHGEASNKVTVHRTPHLIEPEHSAAQVPTVPNPAGMGPSPHIQVDPTGKVSGRGAYLCKSGACWDNVALIQKLSAALKIPLTAEDLAVLRAFRATIDD